MRTWHPSLISAAAETGADQPLMTLQSKQLEFRGGLVPAKGQDVVGGVAGIA